MNTFFFFSPGTLLNISYCTSGSSNFQLVLKVLSSMLDAEPMSLLTLYTSDPTGNINSQLSMTPQELEHILLGQQLALEMLSNICCPEGEQKDSFVKFLLVFDPEKSLHYFMSWCIFLGLVGHQIEVLLHSYTL